MDRKVSTAFVQTELRNSIDEIATSPDVRNNCMFQLSLMLARTALDPIDDKYRQDCAERLLGILRDKPTSNVVSLFRVVSNDDDEDA